MFNKRLILMILIGISSSSFSYNTKSGNLEGYLPYSDGTKEIFFFNLDSTSAAGCNVTNRFAIDSDHKNFSSVVSAVMAAYHSQTPVKVRYEEECNVYSNSFDSSYICVGNIPC